MLHKGVAEGASDEGNHADPTITREMFESMMQNFIFLKEVVDQQTNTIASLKKSALAKNETIERLVSQLGKLQEEVVTLRAKVNAEQAVSSSPSLRK